MLEPELTPEEQRKKYIEELQARIPKGGLGSSRSGMDWASTAFGMGLPETGKRVPEIAELLKSRAGQSDPVSEAIRASKGGAVATANRELAKQGVKGATAAGAVDEISRKRDMDIASSLYGQQRQSIADERDLLGNIISTSFGIDATKRGMDAPVPQQKSFLGTLTGGGKVICTELFTQGLMGRELYIKDFQYGKALELSRPEVVIGYHFWAKPLVKIMQKSPTFTKIVSIPALKWAKQMAGEENSIFGWIAVNVGEPLCGLLGKILIWRNSYGFNIGSN